MGTIMDTEAEEEDPFGDTELAKRQKEKENVAIIVVVDDEVQKVSDLYIGSVIAGVYDKANINKVDEGLKVCSKLRNRIETVREALKKPHLERGREIDAEAKRLQALLEPTESKLKLEMEKVKKAQAKIEKENEDRLWEQRYREMQSVSLDFPESTIRKMPEDEFRSMINTAVERMEEQHRIDLAAAARQKELDAQAEQQRKQQAEIDRQLTENMRLQKQQAQEAEDKRLAQQKIIDDQMELMRKQKADIDAAAEKVRLDKEAADRQEAARVTERIRQERADKYSQRISVLRQINPNCDVDPDWLIDLTDEYMAVAENAQRDIVKKAEEDAKAEAARIEALRPIADQVREFAQQVSATTLVCNVKDVVVMNRIYDAVHCCTAEINRIADDLVGAKRSVTKDAGNDMEDYF